MKILDKSRADWNFQNYLQYWSCTSIPEKTRGIFTDKKLIYPEFRESLHDAWIESLSIRNYNLLISESNNIRKTRDVELILIGAYHDLGICINYRNVQNINIRKIFDFDYGDILIHELSKEDDIYVHEIVFSSE